MDLVAQSADTATTWVIWFLVWAVVFGTLSGLLYQSRGGSFGLGFLLGALLGLIGLIIVLIISPSSRKAPQEFTRKCPHCLQDIPAGASVCHHCGRESEAWLWKEDRWWTREGGKWFWFNVQTGQWVEVEASPEAPPNQPPGQQQA